MITHLYKHIQSTLALVVLLLFVTKAYPQDFLILDDWQVRYDLNADPSGTGFFVRPTNIDNNHLLERLKNKQINLTNSVRPDFTKHKKYGIYIPLKNKSSAQSWVMHFNAFLVDSVEITILHTKQNIISQQLYSFSPTNLKSMTAKKTYKSIMGRGIDITLPKEEDLALYIEFTANSKIPLLHLSLMSTPTYAQWTATVNSIFFLGLGIAFGFIITAFIAGFILRDSTFFWFGASSFLLIGISFLQSHVWVEIIHNESQGPPDWIPLYLSVTLICLLFFVKKFLLLKKESPWWSRSFKAISYIIVVYAILTLFINVSVALQIFSIICIFSILLIIFAGLMKMHKVGKYYSLFMLGWIPVLFYTVNSIHYSYSNVPANESTLNYNIVIDIYYKIIHIFFHLAAIIIRILDLKKKKLIAETNSKAKTRFLASLSHDLRQPIHSMKLLLNQLKNEVASKKGIDILNKLFFVHESTGETFNALINWSKLDAGEVTVCKDITSLDAIFKSLNEEFESIAFEKNLKLHIRPTHQLIYTDPILLKRILRNLLSNAIKYTDSGMVLIAARRRKQSLHIEVWDSGIGIPNAEQTSIFDVYKRTTQAKYTSSGMGIGLANVKLISDVLGFNVNVDSIVQQGSRFTIIVPPDFTLHAESCRHKHTMLSVEKKFELVPVSVVENLIKDSNLRASVNKHLHAWGYIIQQSSKKTNQQHNTRVILTDDLLVYNKSLESTKDGVVMAVYAEATEFENDYFTATDKSVYRLSPTLNPAELRSLLRFSDALVINIK